MVNTPSPLLLSHLRTWADHGGDMEITPTAEALHLTQPAVSQHVQALEQHFGVKLIERERLGRRLSLTPAGRFLAERAAPLIENVAAIDREMEQFSQVRIGRLRLGATVTIGNYGITKYVCAFRRAYPDIALEILVENTAHIAARVHSGDLGIGLIEGAIDAQGLEDIPYADDALTLVLPPDHRLAKMRRAVRAADLESEQFVMREVGSGTRSLFEHAMVSAGITPRVALAMPSSESILQAVEAGLGLAVVSSLVSDAAVRDGRLRRRPIVDLELERTFRLIRRANVTPSPATLAFSTLVLTSACSPTATRRRPAVALD